MIKNIRIFFRETGRSGGTIGGQRSQALILADEILNRLNGYPRKGSRVRNEFYCRDLNWMADVLLRVEAGERNPLRPTGQ